MSHSHWSVLARLVVRLNKVCLQHVYGFPTFERYLYLNSETLDGANTLILGIILYYLLVELKRMAVYLDKNFLRLQFLQTHVFTLSYERVLEIHLNFCP